MTEQLSNLRYVVCLTSMLLVVAWGMLMPHNPRNEGTTVGTIELSAAEAVSLGAWALMGLILNRD